MGLLVSYKDNRFLALQEHYFPRDTREEAGALLIEAYAKLEQRLKQLEDNMMKARIRLREHPYKQLRKAKFLATRGDERYREYWDRQVEKMEKSLL